MIKLIIWSIEAWLEDTYEERMGRDQFDMESFDWPN